MILAFTLEVVPMFTLSSRFVLSIRELHAHDVQGRREDGIDTGFGLFVSGRGVAETVLEFADVGQNERSVDVEEVTMEIVAEPEMGSVRTTLYT